ncbi:(2Fe-2S)-binding protein [Peribacillus deserti]|uniref:(2Fe-2S)-binding protein n=1 Tax=Peribacillus deserti TaxID=673318 RepID=UPI0035B559CD
MILNINSEDVDIYIRAADLLLDTIRESLGLTGSKPGCLNGDCGACTIILDEKPMKSCLMLTLEAEGKKIMTIEGLKNTPIQKAFIEHFAFQCGYCTPGFIMNCHSLIKNQPNADPHTIKEWLQSNICRCTGYQEIETAVLSVLRKDYNK